MIAVSWKLGHKVIYITLLIDQAIRQGRLASPRSITRTRTASWAVGRAAAAVSWSWPARAHSCSAMGQRCCVALLACLARAPMGLECFVHSARGPLLVFAIKYISDILFIVSYTTNHRRTIRFIRVAQLTNIRDAIYDSDARSYRIIRFPTNSRKAIK